MAPQPLDAAGILLDLDGTILETAGDLATATNRTLAEYGRPQVSEEQVRTWIGDGVRALVQFAFEATGDSDEALLDEAHDRFMRHYADCFADRSHPFPGVVATLQHFREAGIPLAVVTNKAAAFTEPLLADLGIRDAFEIVISGDTLPEKKPSPLPLLHAAEWFGVEPADALMVGDSVSDVKAARAAGFAIVCMSYGYNHGQDIRAAEPDAVIDSMMELDRLLADAAPAASIDTLVVGA